MTRETERYRKTATIVAEQLAAGETRQIQTWEGPATISGPSYQVWANDADGDTWGIKEDFFNGPSGYDETGEIVNGRRVYRKKTTADVDAYEVTEDGHEALEMAGVDKPFAPPRGYFVVVERDSGKRRAVEGDKFRKTYELVEEA